MDSSQLRRWCLDTTQQDACSDFVGPRISDIHDVNDVLYVY